VAPINDHLLARGCRADTEYIVIGESPVQFSPPSGDLERETIDQAPRLKLTAQQRGLCEPSTWVAMALQTGRAKELLEQDAVDQSKLEKFA
jgi:hypothetical protein